MIAHYLIYDKGPAELLLNTPSLFAGEFLKRTPLNPIEKEKVNEELRPKEVIFIDIEPEVQELLLVKMREFGIERSVSTISIDPNIFAAAAYTKPTEGILFFGGKLDKETYLRYQSLFDKILLHETFHALDGRASGYVGIGLSELDYIKFRNLQLGLVNKFNPLKDMRRIFNPDGEYANFGDFGDLTYEELLDKINEQELNLNTIALEEYYFQKITDSNANHLIRFLEDFRTGLLKISGFDINTFLSAQTIDSSLGDIFTGLEKKISVMDSFSALVAKTIIDNKDDIALRKRSFFQNEQTDVEYFMNQVLPFTLLHLCLYKSDKLMEACESLDNSEFVKSFLNYWMLELDRFVYGKPVHEFSADLFAGAMMSQGQTINWGNAKKICQQMIDLLKTNELASLPAISSVI